MILYFSGCGNSRWVADTLAEALQERMEFVSDAPDEVDLQEDEALGFVFPVYAWAPPRLVVDYVRRMRLHGRPSYVWFVCTCGDEAGFTRQVFRRALKGKCLSLDAAFSLIMPETYLAFPGFSLDSPENENRKIDKAAAALPRIAALLASRERGRYEVKKGPLPLSKTYLLRPLFYRFIISDRKFHAEEGCIGCGRCERECPLHNIRMVEGRPVWNGNCTQCMSCYHHCPVNAIHYGLATRGKGQYYFGKRRLER